MSSESKNGITPGKFDRLISDVANYLEYQRDEGVREIEIDPDTLKELKVIPESRSSRTVGSISGLEEIAGRVAGCRKCPLCESRNRTVPGQGSSNPDIMFIGEGPGADEDRQGLAFVGRAGQLLTRIIEAMGLTRDEVWIGNIVKCRPPGNRAPHPDEMEACLPYLREQVALLKPKVIVTLGATAVKGLLDVKTGITKLRGNWLSFEEIDVMPTFHPAYLLRNPAGKRDVWEDMKAVLHRLDRKPPERKSR